MGGAGAASAFLLLILQPSDGAAASFAAVYLALAGAACCGPFLAFRSCVAFVVCAVAVCTGCSLARDGAFGPALLGGLFAGLLAMTATSLAGAIRVDLVRPLIAAGLLALLTTFFYWDEAFLFAADDRGASAGLAFALNPAAAASVTLEFDWMHAKALYTNNQTAESMFAVPMPGIGAYAWKLAVVLVPAAVLAYWREERAA